MKLTNKQKVLKRYPKAICYRNVLKTFIIWYDRTNRVGAGLLAVGATAPLAWASAAKRL